MVMTRSRPSAALETASPYQAGLSPIDEEIAAARAQEARALARRRRRSALAAGAAALIDHHARDADGQPFDGSRRDGASLEHPADRSCDHAHRACSEVDPAVYRGDAAIGAGQWDLVIELTRDGERLFRSQQQRSCCARGVST